MTQYDASTIVSDASHQALAEGFPIGKRFKSSEVVLVADGNAVHLGHHAKADGRWRIYAFADAEATALNSWADWMAASAESPVRRFTPAEADVDAVFDVKVIYPQRYEDVDVTAVPEIFRPETGPLGLRDWEKVFAAAPSAWTSTDIFDERGLSREGVVVVVRPDQYVAAVLPLTDTAALAEFFDGTMTPA